MVLLSETTDNKCFDKLARHGLFESHYSALVNVRDLYELFTVRTNTSCRHFVLTKIEIYIKGQNARRIRCTFQTTMLLQCYCLVQTINHIKSKVYVLTLFI
jgi:hypothetical protein